MQSVKIPHPSRTKIRVAIFNTHPIQYYAPLWRKISAYSDFDLTVFYGSDFSVRGYRDIEFDTNVLWDTPLLEGYHNQFLRGYRNGNGFHFFYPSPIPAAQAIFAYRPDVVVLTAYHASFWYGIACAAFFSGAKIVMRHEGNDSAYRSQGFRKIARSFVLKSLYKRVAHFSNVGSCSKSHLIRFGVSEKKMTWSPFCVDSDWMDDQIRFWSPQRATLKLELNIAQDGITIVFSGKLVKKKNPLILVEAIRRLPDKVRSSLHLVVAGSGSLISEMESQARPLLGERYHQLGFLNQSQIGKAYTLGDIFVLPSQEEETWGLVVNEALQFGLPVIVSDVVGCHQDLVPDSTTGRVFKSGDVDSLAQALLSLITEIPTRKNQYSKACRARAELYSLDVAANGLREAILAAYKA